MNGYPNESVVELDTLKGQVSPGPGERLKRTRESFGFTHADIASHLNLRISVIEAIEENNYSQIPKLVFARGYLRSYAKLLKLPSDEIIESFNKLECPEIPSDIPATPIRAGQKKAVKKEHSFMPWATLIVLIVLFSVVGFWKPITHFLANSQPSMSSHSVSDVATTEPKETPATTAMASTSEEGDNTANQESQTALPSLDQFKQEN